MTKICTQVREYNQRQIMADHRAGLQTRNDVAFARQCAATAFEVRPPDDRAWKPSILFGEEPEVTE
jgi:hypothetical protein